MIFYLKRFLPYRPGIGIVLVNNDNLVFVARRLDTPLNAWQMPQGGIEKRERPDDAVFRELKEEIGTNHIKIIAKTAHWHHYDLPKELVKKVWGGRFRGQKQKWFACRFLGQDSDINLQTENPEFCDWRWTEAKDLPHLAVSFKRNTYEQVMAELWPQVIGRH
jgi:putative (di)nucleoside polyphosphate hydrolase